MGYLVAQVTPYPWELDHPVNTYIRNLSIELNKRGHCAVVIGPSKHQSLVHASQKLVEEVSENPELLTQRTSTEPLFLAVSEAIDLLGSERFFRGRLSVDAKRTLQELMELELFDFVHVHEPFSPSVSSSALRYSRALNIGSFHAPKERLLSAQLTRKAVKLFLGRLDARTSSFHSSSNLLLNYFPAEYSVITPGANKVSSSEESESLTLAFAVRKGRGELRTLLRSLRLLPLDLEWKLNIWSEEDLAPLIKVSSKLADRINFIDASKQSREEVIGSADIYIDSSERDYSGILTALANSTIPLASSVPLHQELLGEGSYGLLFPLNDSETLAAQLTNLISDRSLIANLIQAAESQRSTLTWQRLASDFEQIYDQVNSRRHTTEIDPDLVKRLKARPLIDVDLHMHTDHSHDCATPVEVLIDNAKREGLGAIAVTDHNEVSGAFEAEAKAKGIKIIIGEEVKTADQGEVIGLFIKEKIPRGLTLEETIAEIKRQGGIVYVPHPFDRLHSVPDYKNLLAVLDDIDAIEIFNPRVALRAFNEEAVRFALKYRIAAGAGSDAHVVQGLGSVRIRMHDFDGPEEFLASLRMADIIRTPANLFYVQALKFIQTKATPAGARKALRERKIRKAKKRS